MTTTVKDAVADDRRRASGPLRAVENGRFVGIVDREAVLQAIAGER